MKKSHIIAIVAIAISIGAIISTVSDAATYADFTAAKKHPGKEFQVVGELNTEKEIDFRPTEDANSFTFYMIDKNGTEHQVKFKGSKPQDFERSEQVVITGSFEENLFIAEKILMKCPSKYNDGESEELMEITVES